MEKFCPKMSGPVALSNPDYPSYAETVYVNCMQEKCPKWVARQVEGGLVEWECKG